MTTENQPDPILEAAITGSLDAIASLRGLAGGFREAVDLMVGSIRGGGKILACGNGGSAADAAHFMTELLCRFERDRRSLPGIALTADGSFLTATANDYGFDHVFARQVEGLGRPGDVLVGISTSGKSVNVNLALEAARRIGVRTVALLGRDGGPARGLADVDLVVPRPRTAHIQEAHQVLIHALCEAVERRLEEPDPSSA